MSVTADEERALPGIAGPARTGIAAWLSPAHLVLALVLLVMPALVSDFVLFSVLAWSLCLGMVALSLMFLAGYGGMVSLAQLTVAGVAGYMVAILGTNGMGLGLNWPWWTTVPAAIAIAVAFRGPDRRAGGAHRRHLHHHDHPRDRGGVLLFHPPELRDLQWLERLQPGAAAQAPRHRLAPAHAVLLSGAGPGRAQLCRGALCLALDLRPGAAGHPRQCPAHGGDRLRCRRCTASRPMPLPG